MDKIQAQNLIKETFENSFNSEQFIIFIKNLLKKIDEKEKFTYQGNYISDAFEPYINKLERIGKYNVDNNEIDILIVSLKKETSLERARTMQRNFIAKYLNGSRGGKLKDAALVAFVSPNSSDWRFSLVKMDYRFEETPSGKAKVKEEFTPARRWSFLVGPNEKSHTAQTRFLPILENDSRKPTLQDLEEAFNVEKVTKEFFEKFRDLFIKTKKKLDKILESNSYVRKEFKNKNITTVDFSKKLLGQIVFLYFLQKKGWFGVQKGQPWGTGPKNFMRKLFNKEYGDYKNFFNDILEPLFYEALRTDRSSVDHYYSRFDCKIPFLNGGLFDPINDYDWVNTEIVLPDSLFSNTNRTPEGDIGDGIFDVFDRFNFTVNEEEPLEKEVALDPELLGKIYEKLNAIREDNFEEYAKILRLGKKGDETKFNKEYGVYYTPREIVHFMCQQSLLHYLETELGKKVPKNDLETFVKFADIILEHEKTALQKAKQIENGVIKETKYSQKIPESIIQNAAEIDFLLENISICDPAVGSGAFPVGMLHEIVKLRQLLSVYLQRETTSYELKRHCIENSLYGVDIDAGAVETCKLRFWLSMIVDEENFSHIKPLPNLDYKVVCGDSLLTVEKDIFNTQAFEELEKLKPQYFNETNPTNKQRLKQKIDELILKITNGHKEFDFLVYFSEVFHKKGGFDIVIANPPYIQLQKNGGKLANLYSKCQYSTFDKRGDIYCLFYEKGMQILKPGGHLCFITSNKWMRAGYGEKLRNFFLKHNPKILIDLGPGIFESATVDTNILLIQNQKESHLQLRAVTLTKEKEINIGQQIDERGVTLSKLTKDAWFIGSSAEQRLKEKIERIGKPLKEWDVKIYRGVLTGLNEAFIITTEKRNEILANCKDKEERKRTEAIIKPILRGRDIKRYYYEWAGLWVIFIPWHFPLHEDLSIQGASEKAEKEFKRYYSAIYNHLLEFKEQLSKRNKDETGIRYEWYALQRCAATYYSEFEKEKVVWQRITHQPTFCLVEPNVFILDSMAFFTGKNLKFIMALLNSKLIFKYVEMIVHQYGFTGFRLSNQYVDIMPLPPITPANEPIVKQIESLVDKILNAKKQDKNADTSMWEREIDRLVYSLYDLTEEEIALVEKN